MLSKLSSVLVAVGVFSVLLFSGCGSSADLSLKFSPDGATNYKATTEVTKLFRFEQPNLDKLKEEETKTLVEMGFTQTIQSVDADGNATAQITINDLKVDIVNKNESRLSFDSQNEKDQNAPLAKLLGQSYTIEISPMGRVTPLDTKDALAAVTAAYEKKIVKGLFDAESIANRKRRQMSFLSKIAGVRLSLLRRGYWLRSLTRKHTYWQPLTETSPQSKMFDNEDDYTGTVKFDLASGKVLSSTETLISTYTAQEMPENGDPEKGPDVLTMQFINRIQLEKLN
ncbi:MAG: hypothetical protein ACYTBW_07360 [Planctomycetota bacterium]|jgi:hypothetical protein